MYFHRSDILSKKESFLSYIITFALASEPHLGQQHYDGMITKLFIESSLYLLYSAYVDYDIIVSVGLNFVNLGMELILPVSSPNLVSLT